MATDGLLLYNYLSFSNDVLQFMYGSVPSVPFESYKIISSAGLKTVILNRELTQNGKTDTDGDNLTDWQEVKQNKVTVNDDGSVTLPTYYDYLKNGHLMKQLIEWLSQYEYLYDKNGHSVKEMLSNVYVLPVVSDPTLKDTDGDGIRDDVEIEWDGIDVRYKDIGVCHTDTVETLYPEISDEDINAPSYPSYITVSGNDIVVHLKVIFEGDTDVKASSVLKTTGLTMDHQNEVDNIMARLGSDPTLKELAIDGIENRWANSFVGNEFDFCEGLDVNFSIEVTEDITEYCVNDITVIFKSSLCGVSHMATENWSTNTRRIITMYTSRCENAFHNNGDGNSCSEYNNNVYNIAQFAGTCAHEFGHVMGVYDLYPSAVENHGYTIISNNEVYYISEYKGLQQAGCMMRYNGHGTANDIEMVLLAFCENEWQYFVPWSTSQEMSKAIKAVTEFLKEDDANIYIWDETLHSFVIKR